MRTGVALLTTGDLHVRRADAAELRAVRDGSMSYEALVEHAESLQRTMQGAVATTRLPAHADWAFIDALAFELMTAKRR